MKNRSQIYGINRPTIIHTIFETKPSFHMK